MTNAQFKNLLAMMIVLAGPNVLTKSPDYLIEKFIRYVSPTAGDVYDDERHMWGLDTANRATFDTYCQRWNVE